LIALKKNKRPERKKALRLRGGELCLCRKRIFNLGKKKIAGRELTGKGVCTECCSLRRGKRKKERRLWKIMLYLKRPRGGSKKKKKPLKPKVKREISTEKKINDGE